MKFEARRKRGIYAVIPGATSRKRLSVLSPTEKEEGKGALKRGGEKGMKSARIFQKRPTFFQKKKKKERSVAEKTEKDWKKKKSYFAP